jgi:hypothetical protein
MEPFPSAATALTMNSTTNADGGTRLSFPRIAHPVHASALSIRPKTHRTGESSALSKFFRFRPWNHVARIRRCTSPLARRQRLRWRRCRPNRSAQQKSAMIQPLVRRATSASRTRSPTIRALRRRCILRTHRCCEIACSRRCRRLFEGEIARCGRGAHALSSSPAGRFSLSRADDVDHAHVGSADQHHLILCRRRAGLLGLRQRRDLGAYSQTESAARRRDFRDSNRRDNRGSLRRMELRFGGGELSLPGRSARYFRSRSAHSRSRFSTPSPPASAAQWRHGCSARSWMPGLAQASPRDTIWAQP